jgi:thiol-disulfide isomerase/thioredoxin
VSRKVLLILAGTLAAAAGVAGIGYAVISGWEGPGTARLHQRLSDRLMASVAPADRPSVTLGQAVPTFTLPALGGAPARALPGSGRPLLLNYWASWCGPCRREMPLLAAFAREQGPNGIEVVGIALDDEPEASAYLKAHAMPFPNLLEVPGDADSSARLGNYFGLMPFSVLIDAQGRLQHRRTGPFDDAADLRDWIAESGVAAR